jgi:hypothetical protein
MSISPDAPEPQSSPTHRPLNERVGERVKAAAALIAAADRRRRHSDAATPGSSSGSPRDLRPLYHVFRDMGRSQRTARQQSGQPPFSVVRKAAQAFRREPNLPALVLVAASLDEVGLLSW